jgi:hypothetical protein
LSGYTQVSTFALSALQAGVRTTLSPTGQVGTSSASLVMLGISSAASNPTVYTPTLTGKLLVAIYGTALNSTAGDGVAFVPAYGTGETPSNGDAAEGTTVGTTGSAVSNAINQYLPFCFVVPITATVATQLWIDMQFQILTGGSGSLINIGCTIVEATN